MPSSSANQDGRSDAPRAPERRLAGLLVRFDTQRRTISHRLRMNPAEARLLWLLSVDSPRTLRDVGEALELEQSTVNRQVNASIRSGLIQRHRGPDGRAFLVEPTPEGAAAFDADMRDLLGGYGEALRELGDRADEFLDLLDRFTAAYNRDKG